jgi:hypothetical protein
MVGWAVAAAFAVAARAKAASKRRIVGMGLQLGLESKR